ncbi:MAG: N-acetyltransferase [Sphingopyxis sp.]|nr:N-acetyltransferase [Sphingopyxis sp.]
MTVQIHPSSVVDEGAVVGDFTKIWHFCHVEPRAVIGENNNLGQNVYIGNDAVVGNGCRIGNSVSVFANVILEDFVFCAPFMVFTHVYYPRAGITRRDVFTKTYVRTGATIGANATVVPGVDIGRGAFVAAGAVVTTDCPEWGLMVGSPARHIGWVSAYGDKIPLPLEGEGEWRCEATGDLYRLHGKAMQRDAGEVDILTYVPGQPLERILGARDGQKLVAGE